MSKCMYCKHFCFKCLVQIKNKMPDDVALGHCTLDGTGHGDMTLGISSACDCFEYNEAKYERGDVFVSREKVIAICAIQCEYNPNIYRVRSNFGSEWSVSEKCLDENYRLAWRNGIEAGGAGSITGDFSENPAQNPF